MTLKTERRTQLRKRPLSLVYVELPPSNGGMMRDLSEQGFSLRAVMPLRQSEKVPFSFALDTAARIDGEAIVLRIDDGGHVVALEFAGLPSHSRDQIHRWLEKLDEPLSPETAPAQSKGPTHSSLSELRTQIRAPNPPPSAPPVEKSVQPLQSQTATAPPTLETAPPQASSPTLSVAPAVESVPPPPPEPEPLPQEPPPPPPPVRQTVEPNSLPPLLKLSSVRPGPLPAEAPTEPIAPVAIPIPVTEPPAQIQVLLPKVATPAASEKQVPRSVPTPPVTPRRVLPPALEPLSSLEGETDSASPGWMDRFTLGRAISIMLFLTLLAGSYVYHREVGQALIWLGQKIAGQDSPEISKIMQPDVPSVVHPIPEPSPSAPADQPPSPSIQPSPSSTEARGENLPPASEKTPSPQLKGTTPGSLVPLTQVTRPPAPAPPVGTSVETGQQEYLQALQILRAPNRAAELPEAIRLLWVAVEKGNTSAEIDLAELFRQGRGVAKNCDQTRILLTAAARKGSAEARKQLEAFRREGCTE